MNEDNSHLKQGLNFRFGLRVYLFCCLGLVAALPVLVLGIIQVPRWEAAQLEEVDREGRFVSETLVHNIGQLVGGHVRAVETLAGQVQERGTFDPVELQGMVTSQRVRYGGFSFMYVAGSDAVSIASEPPFDAEGKPTAGTNYTSRDYYKELVRTQKTAISRVQIGKRSGVPNVQIVAPIWSEENEMIGFAEGSLDLKSIQGMADRITEGLSGLRAAVLDHEGRVIAHPEASVREAVKNLSELTLFKKIEGVETVIHTGVDDQGVAMRASAAGVQAYGLDWTVVVYRPESAVQTQAADARQKVILVAGLALLAGLGLATLLTGWMARPIRSLADIATDVGRGDFSRLPALPHKLMPREMAALQFELRAMVLELKNYTDKLAQRIQERTEQLAEANRELESFVYSVSHDLKAPVISLFGMATLLKKKLGDQVDEKAAHYLQRLLSNAAFMEQLITDLLNFSRLGKQEDKIEKLNVDHVVHEVLDQCTALIRDRKVKVEVKGPLPDVAFGHTSLCKVFLNFMTNAMKFMGDQAHPTVTVGGREDGPFVEFYIRDNGIGIDPKHHDKVFGVFQRLKEVNVEGTGIGLAVVKKIIDLSGGKVWLVSAKGEGTTFYFRIPKKVEDRKLDTALAA